MGQALLLLFFIVASHSYTLCPIFSNAQNYHAWSISKYNINQHAENIFWFVSIGLRGKLSGNGDARRIFATIAEIVKHYTEVHPNREIFLIGNTLEKNRTYSRITGAFFTWNWSRFSYMGSIWWWIFRALPKR